MQPHHPLSKQTLAIILAAGRGCRMGTLKQTLPWGRGGNSTIITHIYDTLQPHAQAGIAIVVGDHKTQITTALQNRTYSIIQSQTNAQQYESTCRGLTHFISESTAKYALLQPADHPHIPDTVINILFTQLAQSTEPIALIPTHKNKGGHPALIPRNIAKKILTWAQTIDPTNPPKEFQGLKTFWNQNPTLIQRIETNEPKITIDLDTPQDYQQAYP